VYVRLITKGENMKNKIEYRGFTIRKGNFLEFVFSSGERSLKGSTYDRPIWVVSDCDRYDDVEDSGVIMDHETVEEAKSAIDESYIINEWED
tara:strand:+ start:436 stop:711 length:276 start_codon:yes stop_codon:yes gene_type:complete